MKSRVCGRNGERGQSLVEMSIGFVVIMMLLMGLVDLGRVYFIYIALEDGAGEAALYLSLDPECVEHDDDPDGDPSTTECADPNNARYRAETASGQDVGWAGADIQADVTKIGGEPVITAPVVVTIRYPFQPVTPLISAIAGNQPIMLEVRAQQMIVTRALLPGKISELR